MIVKLRYQKLILSFFLGFLYVVMVNPAIAQDTLSGDYNNLIIKSGKHVIKSVVNSKGLLKVEAGAQVEFIDAGILVCVGSVSMDGEFNNKIQPSNN